MHINFHGRLTDEPTARAILKLERCAPLAGGAELPAVPPILGFAAANPPPSAGRGEHPRPPPTR